MLPVRLATRLTLCSRRSPTRKVNSFHPLSLSSDSQSLDDCLIPHPNQDVKLILAPAAPDFIVRVATHPRNWPWIAEDGTSPETYQPVWGRLYFAHGEQGWIGAERLGRYTWGFHVAMLPKATGVKEFAQEVLDFLVLVFDAKKFLSSTPADNRAALRLVRSLGGVQEGHLKTTHYRNGKMQDVIIYGMTLE